MSGARSRFKALLLALLSRAAAHYLYCRHCGSPVVACDELEHVVSPLALHHTHTHACGETVRAQRLPYAAGALALRVRASAASPEPLAFEASGSSFVRFTQVRDAEGPLRAADPANGCVPAPLADDDDGAAWRGSVVVAERGNCTFEQKALVAQRSGAAALVVVDTEKGMVAGFTMSGSEPEAGEVGVTIPVLIISRADGRTVLRLARAQPPVVAAVDGFEREVLTARAGGVGLASEDLPGTASAAQRRTSWFPGYNYRQSKCRVCSTPLGFFFNRTAVADAAGDEAERPGADEGAGEGAGDGADEGEGEGEGVGSAGSASASAWRPHAFHVLLTDEIADAASLGGMTADLRIAPVL